MNTSSSSSSSLSSTPLPILYEQWNLHYPSALASFSRITQHAKSKRIVLFLDYDGTLSPIVNDPELAIMSAKMHSVLKEVVKHFTTSIISCRSRTKVKQFVELKELYYAGSHGRDIEGPDGQQVLEIQPQDQWNKGNAVQFLLKTLRLEDCSGVLPIYIGYDGTNEDAFKVLRNRGGGCGILVSSVPKETLAHYSLKNPNEVMKFLECLVIWKELKSTS